MATVTVTPKPKVVVTADITVTLTTDEARLVADLLDGSAEPLRKARLANGWLYTLICDLEDATA